jgi:hypothetical protein
VRLGSGVSGATESGKEAGRGTNLHLRGRGCRVELLVEGINFGLLLLHLRLERRCCCLAGLGALAEARLELLHLLLQRRHLQREREREQAPAGWVTIT